MVRDAASGMPVVTRCSSTWAALVAPEGVTLHDPAFLPSIFSAGNLATIAADMTLLETEGRFESTIHHRDRWLHCRGHAISTGVSLVSVVDVTDEHEKRRLELALMHAVQAEKEAREAALAKLDLAFDLVVQIEIKDYVLRHIYCSESHRAVLGRDPQSLYGDVMALPHISPSFLEHEIPEFIAACESGKVIDGLIGNVSLLHADGHLVWFEWRFSSDKEHRGRGLLVFRDITDRRARDRLQREKEALTKLDIAFDLVVQLESKDGVCSYIYCSDSFRSVLGRDPESLYGDVMSLPHIAPSFLVRTRCRSSSLPSSLASCPTGG